MNNLDLKNKFCKLLVFLKNPFKQDLSFFLFLFFLASFVNFIHRSYFISIPSGIRWSLYGFVDAYFLCLILPLLKQFPKARCAYKEVVITLGVLNLISDAITCFIANNPDVEFVEFIGLILGTNVQESIEFFQHYLSFSIIPYSLCGLAALLLIYKIATKVHPYKIYPLFGLTLLFCAIPIITIDKYGFRKNIFLGKIHSFVKEFNQNNRDLKNYYNSPQLIVNEELPDNLIIIIGESLSKDFCSLYGYSKNTNPLLSTISDSSLFVFNNVTSAELKTVENIQYLLSTYNRSSNKNWYECTTIPEILSTIGYKTYWISNQSEVGLWDNIPTKYANLCDTTLFVGNKTTFSKTPIYDEAILDPFKHLFQEEKAYKKAFFIHLLGSHPFFGARYPKNRKKYNSEDYPLIPIEQREMRAHYDNSIIYNDSLINEIFKVTEKNESISFYFSDHGLDIFAVDPDYVGHGRKGIKASEEHAKRIPFMIYCSKQYLDRHQNEIELINNSLGNEFVSDDFLFSLMDILGVELTEEKANTNNSLFGTGDE